MEETHEIDPDGDTYLILCNANAPFAVWERHWPDIMKRKDEMDEDMEVEADEVMNISNQYLLENGAIDESDSLQGDEAEEESASETEHEPSEAPSSPIMSLDGHGQQEESPVVRFRLSSRHLILASSYFNRMLTGPWKENSVEPGCDYTISARDWDVEALLILMNIIHGQARKVPRKLSTELLAKVSVIVDYYQCIEVVEIFVDRWLLGIPPIDAEIPDRDLMLRLLISWVFSDSHTFTAVTARLLCFARGPINSLKLPVPEAILNDLERDRKVICGGLIRLFHEKIGELAVGTYGCSYECSSMLLGVLTGHLYNYNLFPYPPKSPYVGVSFERLMHAILTIREPEWCGNDSRTVTDQDVSPYGRGPYLRCFLDGPHGCTVSDIIEPAGREIPQPVGLSLETYT